MEYHPVTAKNFYRCSACRSLIQHESGETEKHDEWHEKIAREISLANIGFGGLGFGSRPF